MGCYLGLTVECNASPVMLLHSEDLDNFDVPSNGKLQVEMNGWDGGDEDERQRKHLNQLLVVVAS
jgi:hypothetical protein